MAMRLTVLMLLFYGADTFGQLIAPSASPAAAATSAVPASQSPVVVASTQALGCSEKVEDFDQYVPLPLLDILTSGQGISASFVDGTSPQVRINVPPFLSDCLALEIGTTEIVNNNIVIGFKNSGIETYAQYEECLLNTQKDGRPLATRTGAGLSVDYSKMRREAIGDLSVDLGAGFDRSKNMKIYFKSPKTSKYAHQESADNPSVDCFIVEDVREGGLTVYRTPEDEARQNAFRACQEGVGGNYRNVLEEIARLEASEVGNAQFLVDVLRDILLTTRQREAAKIASQLERIDGQLEDLLDQGEDSVSRSKVREFSKQYRDLWRKLDADLVNPVKEEILALIDEYRNRTDPDRREEIAERIEKLNDILDEYAKIQHPSVVKGFEAFALTDIAKDIMEVRLKAEAYKRTYVGDFDQGRGQPFHSSEEADGFVRDSLETYERKTLSKWSLAYRAKSGDRNVLREQGRRMDVAAASIQRNRSGYMQNERRLAKNCERNFLGQIKNPAGCQRFHAGKRRRNARAMRRNESLLQKFQRAQGDYNRYKNIFDRYERESEGSWTDEFLDDDYGSPDDIYSFGYGGGGANMIMPNMLGASDTTMMGMPGMMGNPNMVGNPNMMGGSSFMGPSPMMQHHPPLQQPQLAPSMQHWQHPGTMPPTTPQQGQQSPWPVWPR